MLGYISSTRKKSCYACVKSKRRCDLGYPFCKRCFIKGLDCKYPNATPRDTNRSTSGATSGDVVLRQTTPDIAPPATSAAVDISTEPTFIDTFVSDASIESFLCISSSSSGSTSSPENIPPDPYFRNDWNVEIPPLLPPSMFVAPKADFPAFLNRNQVSYVISGILTFPATMACAGSTLFLHRDLYAAHKPDAYQDCVALSALYMAKTPRNRGVLANSIGRKISGLVSASATWTLLEHLAAVQALIVYQVIRLFDPDLGLQGKAERDNGLLEVWSALLWKRFFEDPQVFDSSYARYVFQESLRRTVLMAVFTRCGWSVLTRGGLANQVPVLARLPIASDLEAWECGPEEWCASAVEGEVGLVNYGEWVQLWDNQHGVEELDPFGRMLLGACRGKDFPRLLVDVLGS
jgi:hypothetical protein